MRGSLTQPESYRNINIKNKRVNTTGNKNRVAGTGQEFNLSEYELEEDINDEKEEEFKEKVKIFNSRVDKSNKQLIMLEENILNNKNINLNKNKVLKFDTGISVNSNTSKQFDNNYNQDYKRECLKVPSFKSSDNLIFKDNGVYIVDSNDNKKKIQKFMSIPKHNRLSFEEEADLLKAKNLLNKSGSKGVNNVKKGSGDGLLLSVNNTNNLLNNIIGNNNINSLSNLNNLSNMSVHNLGVNNFSSPGGQNNKERSDTRDLSGSRKHSDISFKNGGGFNNTSNINLYTYTNESHVIIFF
jgi:hypothetical protein